MNNLKNPFDDTRQQMHWRELKPSWAKKVDIDTKNKSAKILTNVTYEGFNSQVLYDSYIGQAPFELKSWPEKVVKKEKIDEPVTTELVRMGASHSLEIAALLEQDQPNGDYHLFLDCDYFLNVAKLRALRFLLEKREIDFTLTAHRHPLIDTYYDYWNNSLRNSIVMMSAMSGGADFFYVEPHDRIIEKNNKFSRSARLAQNTFDILEQESHLSQVDDPCAGSFVVENLTSLIIDKTLEHLENWGKEYAEKEAKNCLDQRWKDLNSRKKIVTGINQFSKKGETLESLYGNSFDISLSGRVSHFEKLKRHVEDHPIDIYLVICGPLAKLSARAGFCRDYFEIVGVNVIEVEQSKLTELASAHKNLIICALDDDYNELISQDLNSKGKMFIAGKKEFDGFDNLFMGQNVYEVLSQFLGVEK